MRSKNTIPTARPVTAGIKANRPRWSDISIAGIRSDQTEAATITPEANPRRILCTDGFMEFLTKNTHAAPRVVPRNGIITPETII